MLINDDDDNCEVFVDCNYNTAANQWPDDDDHNGKFHGDDNGNVVEGNERNNGNDIIDIKASSDDLLFDCNFIESTTGTTNMIPPSQGNIIMYPPGMQGVNLKTTHLTGMGISHELVSQPSG